MTRQQVTRIINDIRIHSDYPWKHHLSYLEENDAQLRAGIRALWHVITIIRDRVKQEDNYDKRTSPRIAGCANRVRGRGKAESR